MTIKLDINKAYDQVNYNFLFDVMKKMGFSDRWVLFIGQCITTMKFNVYLNGDYWFYLSKTWVKARRSYLPYLFLLVQNVLSLLISSAVNNNVVEGFKVKKNNPILSHLFFADDSLIFCKASLRNGGRILAILEAYGSASGQLINYDKSEVIFSPNLSFNVKVSICEALKR